GGTYYVRSINDTTVKLYRTPAQAAAPYQGFSPSQVSGSTFGFNGQHFRDGDAVTYLAPAPASFRSTDVLQDTNVFGGLFGEYYLNLPGNGGLHDGDLVVYETNDTRGTPIAGLVNGQTYVAHLRFGGGVLLTDLGGHLALGAPDTSVQGRSATEELRR